jgi:cellulose synthase/poly-beta-1,6-N-acetylglucosamine synthase-like glycosyltransferase
MVYFIIIFSFLFLYSYILYPLTLAFLLKNKKLHKVQKNIDFQKKIAVVIPAYNESQYIDETIFNLKMALSGFTNAQIYVGDDGSEDSTFDILSQIPQINISKFNRIGKGNVLNQIIEQHQLKQNSDILIFLDANIKVDQEAVKELVSYFTSDEVGIVGTYVMPSQQKNNIESEYVLRENRWKWIESVVFGNAIGVFGACYGMRSKFYNTIPSDFITDDLFLSMHIVQSKKRILINPEAQVFENMESSIINEFNRKKRYAAGNFQVFFKFLELLNPFEYSFGFVYSYIFHKVVRWFLPVFAFLIFIFSIAFLPFGAIYKVLSLLSILILLYLWLIYKNKINIDFQKSKISYFLFMNLAILIGFFSFLKGIKKNTWQRSDR